MIRKFSTEYKAEAVRLVIEGGASALQVSKDLGIGESTLSKWLNIARRSAAPEVINVNEREELRRLKAENQKLRLERELLKKAAVFFANERTS